MTDEKLRKLLADATPGPWFVNDDDSGRCVDAPDGDDSPWGIAEAHSDCGPGPDRCRHNAALIAAAPDLAAEVLRLRAGLKAICDDAPNEPPRVWDEWGNMVADTSERHGELRAEDEHWRCAQIARAALGDAK